MLARDNAKIVTLIGRAPWISMVRLRLISSMLMSGRTAFYVEWKDSFQDSTSINHDLEQAEIQLIDTISRFPGEVQRAAEEYKTLHITNLAFELARDFNDFYKQCPVLKAEPGVRQYRLRLVAAARQTIANALNLLSIEAPDVM